MSFGSTLVAIVAILAFAAIRIARERSGTAHRIKRHDRHAAQEQPSPREIELAREVEDLRERIAVLERIATEDRHGKAIAEEIEKLR